MEDITKFKEKLKIKRITIGLMTLCFILGILENMFKFIFDIIGPHEKVSGYYRLRDGKLRWVNGYWRAKRVTKK